MLQQIHECMLQNNTQIHVANKYTNTCYKTIHEYMLQIKQRIHVTTITPIHLTKKYTTCK